MVRTKSFFILLSELFENVRKKAAGALLIISNYIIVIILYHYGKIINNPENHFYLLKSKNEYKIYRTC
jgi:hypothetical protein